MADAVKTWAEMPRQGVYVESLMLTNFRSYTRASVKPQGQSPIVVLTGENGAGKTNVLEALSYLAPGRGLRRATLDDVLRQGSTSPWAVAATLDLAGESVKVGTGQDIGAGQGDSDTAGTKRLVRIDGLAAANSNVLGDRWAVTWLTPQMDRLFTEGPASRRRFLDRLVLGLYADHSRQVGAYERVMRERNRLMGDKGTRADPAWLSAIEARMAEHAVAVATARLDYAGQLAGQLAEAEDGPFPKAELAIDGWIEGLLADGVAAVEAEAAYRDKLMSGRARDMASGRTHEGVHKTDLVVTHAPKAMQADLCSTGEQKALLIALVLANAKLQSAIKGQAPLMLLDEIVAHLDGDRRSALFDALAALGGQCWLTGTDRSLFEALKGRAEFFDVAGGAIQPCHG
ncbi:DNA replication/repair protein RecF [Kordiimonas sp.]|uniref:DNA replication/repair protein RecF n=1 Tax=Kordiimonas sp. TaxID=1970157 RepID=UPI003A8F517D